MRNIRDTLFRDWHGCSNHVCVVTGPKKGMGTNGPCNCLTNASRQQLRFLERGIRILISDQESEAKEQSQ